MEALLFLGTLLLLGTAGFVEAKPWQTFDNSKAECRRTCPTTDPDKLNVHIVPHSHDDVGWLKTVDQYYYGRRTDIQRAGVQYIIDSVIVALQQNPERRFIQVETAFFHKWWKNQTPEQQEIVKNLINSGQLEITGGAWSMNDEAAAHYQSVIDQFSFGLRVINDTLGSCARPTIGWQIDPFGHSREMASMFAQMSYDAVFFTRMDWRDKASRLADKRAELLWQGSPNLGDEANLFTSVLYHHYSAPPGFCFDIHCQDDPIIDDTSIPDYNYESKIGDFAEFVREQADLYKTNNIIITMGDDFNYEDALSYFKNLDLVVKGFQLFKQEYNGKEINLIYSTPSCYAQAVNDYLVANGESIPTKSDDFFPYASGDHSYWSGYYTSRPTSKRFERQGNNLLQVTKQIGVYSQLDEEDADLVYLKEAIGIMQHHDAITGTEKQHVSEDYHRILSKAFDGAIGTTEKTVSNLLSKGSNLELSFSSCILANMSYCPISQGGSFVATLYNPLAQTVSEYVRLPVDYSEFTITGPDGEAIAYQIVPTISDFQYMGVSTAQNDLVFRAVDIPPHGLKMFYVSAGTRSEKPAPDTSDLRLTLGDESAGFSINEDTGFLESITIDSKTVAVNQRLMYYIGCKDNGQASGAYIFRPMPDDSDAKQFGDKATVTVYKGDLVDEVHQVWGDWAKQVIRVYKDTNYIEFDWLVGPIDISDDKGREVISRFATDVDSNDVFYTDANGREMLERKRNSRPDFNYTNEEPIAGNYYPVTSKISMKNDVDNVQFAVLNERAQGGTSLQSGEVELMVHRRLLSDDGFGVGEALNETAFEQGLVARGQHFVTLGSVTNEEGKTSAANERILALRKLLQPWVFLSDTSGKSLGDIQENYNFVFAGLTRDLPENVHILTLEPWKMAENRVLLRLEHILEKNEDASLSQDVTVDLNDLFVKIKIDSLEEMTLDGNQLLSESKRLEVNQASIHRKGDLKALEIVLTPMQIRTFIATVQFI